MLRPLEKAPLSGLWSLPDGPPPAQGWPTILFLHGHDEAAPLPPDQALTRHGPLHPANPPEVRAGFLIVAPQLPQPGDHWVDFASPLADVLAPLIERGQCDRSRCYLSGFSFGGNGVLDLGLHQPERWAALWPVDPTRLPRQKPTRPIWLSIGQLARRLEMRFIEALALEPAGVDAQGERMYLDEGADHVGAARLAYRDPRIYRWLLQHRLPSDGHG